MCKAGSSPSLALRLPPFPGVSAPRVDFVQICGMRPGVLLAFPLVWGAVLRGGVTLRAFQRPRIANTNVSASSFFFQQRSPCQVSDPVEEVGGVWGHWEPWESEVRDWLCSGDPMQATCSPGHLFPCWEVPEALRPHRQAPERGGARLADKWRRPRAPTLLPSAVRC